VTGAAPGELVRELLGVRAAPGDQTPIVRLAFTLRDLLTFSFVLDVKVMRRLAALGVRLEVCLGELEPQPAPRDGESYEVGVEVWTDARDPGEVARRLEVAPSLIRRLGEPLDERGARLCKRGVWRLDLERDPPVALGALVEDLVARFTPGAAWPEICRDYDARLRFSLTLGELAGGFALEPAVVTRLGALGIPLGWFFYNYCAGSFHSTGHLPGHRC
jgi:hypothetical protein